MDDFPLVKGVSRNRLTMEWVKLKTLGQDSSSLQKELQIFKRFVGCGNIVQCYGDMVSIDQGMLVSNLFLEYAPGGSLLDLMIKKYGGMIPEGDAKCYARMLLEGNGSICRLKIADFGLVRRPRERHHMPDPWVPTFTGTAVYMSPESVIYGHISTALDIWSIGCIVLEMITGKLP
ncbi:mitogen-activated protein kinase kinase kinase 3-like [Durio zibethinus]|uniref:Mitogen-activated protein kinase kinase kinase 3-like n=1 Tax=Durio zibethinus TaxID=66656 RepID=A0A6P6A580_DURZI|nr:mitogen-activated protein kinase kinase kinase 3-like [Durio zibethinus]